MTRVVWSPASRDDLRAIKSYISRDAPRTAEAFVVRIIKSVRRLKRFPLSGSVVPEFGNPEIREILCGGYRIIYRTMPGKVEIVTVYHSARLLGDDMVTVKPR